MTDDQPMPGEPVPLRIPEASDPPGGAPVLYANLIDSVSMDGTVMLDFSLAYPITGVSEDPDATSAPVRAVERVRVARVFVPESRLKRWLGNVLANQARDLAAGDEDGSQGEH